MGSQPGVTVEGEGYLFSYIAKSLGPECQFFRIDQQKFLCCVGTMVYRARTGWAALERLAQAADLDSELERCRGHFALVEGSADGVRIRRDPGAGIELFLDPGRGVLSTSFLAVARGLPRRVLRRHEAHEYLFHGHTLGTETVLEGIRRLDEGEEVRVGREVRVLAAPRPPVPPPASGSRTALAGQTVELLTQSLREVAAAFSGRASLALSGGYDTRLVLALARRVGLAPDLFVYGAPTSSDVRFARLIAEREGLQVAALDKSALYDAAGLDEGRFRDVIRQNYLNSDGLAAGGVFMPPAEAIARPLRHQGGAVALHGGCGESFRNFFGLPDRPTSTRDIATLFYRVPGGATPPGFSVSRYAGRIAAKMDLLLGGTPRRIERHMAEALYPRFRYRFLIGKELTTNARTGRSFLPFFDAASVRQALSIPVAYKNYGNFEAEMIRIADPGLAAHPSSYGHDFSRDAPLRPTLKSWALQQRPAWVRQAQFRLAAKRRAPARLWHEEWALDLLDLDGPVMRELVDVAALRRSDVFGNACNLSLLIRDLQVTDIA